MSVGEIRHTKTREWGLLVHGDDQVMCSECRSACLRVTVRTPGWFLCGRFIRCSLRLLVTSNNLTQQHATHGAQRTGGDGEPLDVMGSFHLALACCCSVPSKE